MSDITPEHNDGSETPDNVGKPFSYLNEVQPTKPSKDENTSGTDGRPPYDIERLSFNWGAFGIPAFWLIAHNCVLPGVMLIVLGFVNVILKAFSPPLYWISEIGILIYCVVLGAQGHKTAWKSRRFDSIEQYFDVQQAWFNWSMALLGITLAICVINE